MRNEAKWVNLCFEMRTDRVGKFLGLAIVIIGLAGCHRSVNPTSRFSILVDDLMALWQDQLYYAEPPRQIVVNVGPAVITTDDVETLLQKNENTRIFSDARASRLGLHNLVQEMGYEKLVFLAAKQMGINQDPSFRHQRHEIEQTALTQYFRKKMDGSLWKPTDQEIKAWHESHKDLYDSQKKGLLVSVIRRPTLPEAQMVLGLLEKGMSFEKVAKQLSLDPAAVSEGILLEAQPVEVQHALVTLPKGRLSKIIQSPRGYEIYRINGTGLVNQYSPTDINLDIAAKLHRKKFIQWVDSYCKANNITIRIDEDALNSIPLAR